MSTTRVHRGQYKDQASFIIESETLRAEFVAHGGRMVSLRHRNAEFEFLVQQPGDSYRGPKYGMPLESGWSAGYDDMFPTIDPCFCEDAPWAGTHLPDHGEAWSINWDVKEESESICFSYAGVQLPYTFTRRVRLLNAASLRMEFRLENKSAFPFSYIWSAHPMFAVSAGTTFFFPGDCNSALTVVSASGRLGSFGEEISWPTYLDMSGHRHDLAVVRESDVHDHEKYFFKNRLTTGLCGLRYPEARLGVDLKFPVERTPYVGVVLAEGWLNNGDSFLLLEPCTAPFDRVDISKRYTNDSRIGPRDVATWHLDFEIIETSATAH